jgi:hypothetical protein
MINLINLDDQVDQAAEKLKNKAGRLATWTS